MKGLFITGTDTDVGKTYIGVRLTEYFYRHQFPAQPRKPVETGCSTIDGRLFPADAALYYDAVEQSVPLDTICPHRFILAASPPDAASQEGKTLFLNQLIECNSAGNDDFLIVEGAGGFYSPIADDGLNADLAEQLELDVLIIAADRLGAINQTLLTVEAVKKSGLNIAAIILNQTENSALPFDNLKTLRSLLNIPLYRAPYAANDEILKPIFKPLASPVNE